MGMDRKFLQIAHTRARRYANHHSGRKCEEDSGEVRDRDEGALEDEKTQAASISHDNSVLAHDDRYCIVRRKSCTEKKKAGERTSAVGSSEVSSNSTQTMW